MITYCGRGRFRVGVYENHLRVVFNECLTQAKMDFIPKSALYMLILLICYVNVIQGFFRLPLILKLNARAFQGLQEVGTPRYVTHLVLEVTTVIRTTVKIRK